MTCDDCEELILEALDTSLPEDRRTGLQQHLILCAGCRQFQQAQRQLDAALAESVGHPALPRDFSARILQRVDAEVARKSLASVEARKQAAEAEYRARLVQLRRGPAGSRMLRRLDLIGLGAVGLLVGLFLSSLLPQLARVPMPSLPTGWQGLMTYLPWGLAAVATAAGLALGSRRDLLARLRI
jgi:hypothetical protein